MAKAKSSGSKSKFDFQGFLLEKGEKVGLIIAGVGCVLLVLFGIMAAAGAANPNKLTTEINSGISRVDSQLVQTQVEPPPVEIPDKDSVFLTVKPTDYRTPNDLFNPAGTISEKRNNPTILAVLEGVARYQIGAFGVVMVQNDQVAIIKGRDAPVRNKGAAIINRDRDKNKGKGIGPKGDQGPAPVPQPIQPPPGFGQGKGAQPKAAPPARISEAEIQFLSLADPAVNNAVFAINLRPVRMARIQGIVPYKAQVAKHMSALRLASDAALTAERKEPVYRGFNVERQILDITGKKVIEDWTSFDHVEAMRQFQEPAPGQRLLFAAYEKIDERYKPFIPEPVHQLFMKAPLLAHGSYDLIQLESRDRALLELEKSGPPQDLTNKEKALKGKDDVFSPDDLVSPDQVGVGGGGSAAGGPPGKGGPPPKGGGGPKMEGPPKGSSGGGGAAVQAMMARTNAAPVWMLQFFDPTIQAGYSYKYRVQLKAENPNYGQPELVAFPLLAQTKELVSEWFEIPEIVVALPEEHFYAHGEKHRDRALYGQPEYDTTVVRYHRWYDYAPVYQTGPADPIGEWVIADINAKRGQYIEEREKNFKVPLWSMVANSYTFRDAISKVGSAQNMRRGENVKMTFSPTTPVLLADFSGGVGNYKTRKGETVKDECAGEILIVTGNGDIRKVTAQNTVKDRTDDRKSREDAWIRWLEEVRVNTDKVTGKGGAGS